MRIHDLTRPLGPGMPVYPGDPPVCFRSHASLEADGYRVTEVGIGTHAGTHVDAPAHFLPQGATVDRLPLEKLVGPVRVLDGEDDALNVAPGDRLLFRSGWSAHWERDDYFARFPTLPGALVERIAGAPAALVGLETPSLHPDAEEDARRHRLLLEAGVVILENLVGLEALPENVYLIALPLPLVGADGTPCRVVALETGFAAESERP